MSGYLPHRRQVAAMRLLAWGVLAVGLVTLVPALRELVHWLVARSAGDEPAPLPAWIYLLSLIAALHGGYAVYLWQLPDWGAARSLMFATLALCAGYAMILGATIVSGRVVWFLAQLQLSEAVEPRFIAGWAFIMLCLTSTLSYFSARLSHRWQRAMS